MQRTITILVDDFDGESEAAETVGFALDGVAYEVDLTAEHAAELRELVGQYVAVGRRVGGRKRRGAGNSAPAEPAPEKQPRRRRGKGAEKQ